VIGFRGGSTVADEWFTPNNAVRGALSAYEWLEVPHLDEIDPLDDFEDMQITLHFRTDGSLIGLCFDICDIRTICLMCGNGLDCCVCD
jgi:hypothetical protein